ncbi:hypothetical protein AMEC673_10180 [Alteromonas macleodii str. 'English Channel 673']|uniref:Uncharacterized protein n=1 Tax=Alteromonas macleodii (strain English Channel 673) TaxID=1004788 RepID=A0AB32ZYW8_ALTME|nr:hypothetical protein [Alteromonas macleodii]AFT74730.1 hypothetical protein AMEC673_10180 [Alteromonas macleodii str. 'English Channel 673']
MLENGLFEVRLDYKPATGSADRVFLAMAEYVSAFEELVHVVGHSIDPEADFSYQLSAVEQGSIKAVINCASILKCFSKTLCKIPEYIAGSMVELDEIDSEEDIDDIATHVEDEVKKSIDIKFPNELNINRLRLAEGVKKLVNASIHLIDGETVDLKSGSNNLVFLNTKVRFDKDPSSLFNEILREVKKTETLLIKKPVFFGDAMWDFKSIERSKSFSAPILDEPWLKRYQNRELAHIDPGDAIIALVSYEAHKAKGAKHFSFSNHKILHVERPIRRDELQSIFDLECDSDEA